jgi:UTP-glucose-1-phosphate uridylyltransferase
MVGKKNKKYKKQVKMLNNLQTIIFDVAGLGTRLYPYSKIIPKHLVLIFNKSMIEYAFDEAKRAGFTKVIIIYKHTIIKDYIKNLGLDKKFHIQFVLDQYIDGTGNSLGRIERFIKDDYFALAYPDDFLLPDNMALLQLKKSFQKKPAIYLLITRVKKNKKFWGMIEVEDEADDRIKRIISVKEKPNQNSSKYTYGIIARYILHRSIFPAIRRTKPNREKKIELSDALQKLIEKKDNIIPIFGIVSHSLIIEGGQFPGISLASFLLAKDWENYFYIDEEKTRKKIINEIKNCQERIHDYIKKKN